MVNLMMKFFKQLSIGVILMTVSHLTFAENKVVTQTWHLENVRQIAREHPDTFYVPSMKIIRSLKKGDIVKLMFINEKQGQFHAERMWVIITQIKGDNFTGELDNDPYEIQNLKAGDEIHFKSRHIMAIYEE